MMTTASPRTWSSPAAIATSLPKLRLNETAPMRGSPCALRLDQRQRIVPAAVVDEDDLPDRRDAVEHRDEPSAERLDVLALVVDRNNDAEFWRRQAIVLSRWPH